MLIKMILSYISYDTFGHVLTYIMTILINEISKNSFYKIKSTLDST